MRRAGLTWNGDPRVKPPFGAAEINWGHPYSQDLLYSWLVNEGGGPALDRVKGTNLGLIATPWIVAQKGLGARFNGTSSYGSFAGVFGAAPVITVTMLIRWAARSGAQVFLESTVNYNNVDGTFIAYTDETAGRLYAGMQDSVGAVTYREEYITIPSLSDWHWLTIIYHNTNRDIRIWLDGAEQSTTISANSQDQSSGISDQTIYVGSRAGSSYFSQIDLADLRINRRDMSNVASMLYVEPYAFLQPTVRRRYFVAAAGGATWPGWISSRGGWS